MCEKPEEKFAKAHESMLKLLECPICFRRITPPVQVCTNGHAICKTCLTEIQKCPICNSMFSANKNTTLDKILEECIFPCTYSDSGCSVELKLADIEQHEQKLCKHRIIKCPVRQNADPCYTELPLYGFRQHVFDHHTIIPIQGKSTRQILTLVCNEVNTLQDTKTCSVILEMAKLDNSLGTFSITYQHVGEAEEAEKWTFEIEFKTEDKLKEIKFKSLLSPFGWDENEIKKTGRYLELNMNLLNKFVIDGYLVYSLKIKNIATKLFIKKALKKVLH